MTSPSHPTTPHHRPRSPLSAVTHLRDVYTHPFASAEQAWFWFIRAARALPDGAHPCGGMGSREAADSIAMIWEIVDRLRRNRRLLRDHLFVLRHYGARAVAPIPHRRQEARAATLWRQAMQVLEGAFVRHGLVRPKLSGGHIS